MKSIFSSISTFLSISRAVLEFEDIIFVLDDVDGIVVLVGFVGKGAFAGLGG